MALPAPGPRVRPQQPALPRRRANVAATIEDQIRYSYFVPDPGLYSADNTRSQDMTEPKALGKISSAQLPSALDHAAKLRAFVPGPGAYDTPDTKDFALPEGGRLNRNAPVERMKLDEYPKPAPGHYGVPHDPTRPRQLGGRFGKDPKVTKFIQDEVMRSRGIPAPGSHDVQEALEAVNPFCPEGGRVLASSRPPGYFDLAATLTQDNPGPDAYDLPGGLNVNRAQGRLVFRYESATMSETKEMVARLVGQAEEAPGPGTYDLPDPPPIAGVPSLKSRAAPFAMPHPFAYNCAPDYGNKFVVGSSVLQANSSEQIFGTGVKKGAAAKAKTSRPTSGDRLPEREVQVSVGLLAADQPEPEVEWRAGGFSNLKKAKSAVVIRPEHPMVLEAAKCYPSLQRKNRDGTVFLPMASRRSEIVSTRDNSEEWDRLRCGKWQLAAVAANIERAAAAVLEPLDEEKLKREALRGLQDKAKERMRLEGVSRAQREAVLEEMRGVLAEQVKPGGGQRQTASSARAEAPDAGGAARDDSRPPREAP